MQMFFYILKLHLMCTEHCADVARVHRELRERIRVTRNLRLSCNFLCSTRNDLARCPDGCYHVPPVYRNKFCCCSSSYCCYHCYRCYHCCCCFVIDQQKGNLLLQESFIKATPLLLSLLKYILYLLPTTAEQKKKKMSTGLQYPYNNTDINLGCYAKIDGIPNNFVTCLHWEQE